MIEYLTCGENARVATKAMKTPVEKENKTETVRQREKYSLVVSKTSTYRQLRGQVRQTIMRITEVFL